MSPPAFVSELMGLTLYLHIDRILDDVFADEPEARDRVRALLREIMTDEMAHVGQRRNFIGPIGLARLARHGRADVPGVLPRHPRVEATSSTSTRWSATARPSTTARCPPDVVQRSWIPSYCQ